MKDDSLRELASLFFETRQIIRGLVRGETPDTNVWLRYETMHYIDEADGPTMRMIAEYLRVKAPSATSLIAHLQRAGMVERRSEGSDKRIVRIYMTARGKKDLRTYRSRSADTMRRAFSKLPESDVRTLTAMLRRTVEAHRQKPTKTS